MEKKKGKRKTPRQVILTKEEFKRVNALIQRLGLEGFFQRLSRPLYKMQDPPRVERIKQALWLRRSKGWGVGRLGNALGVSKQTISNNFALLLAELKKPHEDKKIQRRRDLYAQWLETRVNTYKSFLRELQRPNRGPPPYEAMADSYSEEEVKRTVRALSEAAASSNVLLPWILAELRAGTMVKDIQKKYALTTKKAHYAIKQALASLPEQERKQLQEFRKTLTKQLRVQAAKKGYQALRGTPHEVWLARARKRGAEALAWYIAGHTRDEIADIMQIPNSSVSELLKKEIALAKAIDPEGLGVRIEKAEELIRRRSRQRMSAAQKEVKKIRKR